MLLSGDGLNPDKKDADGFRSRADAALERRDYRTALDLYSKARDSYVVGGFSQLVKIAHERMNDAMVGIKRTDPEHFKLAGYKLFFAEDEEELEVVEKAKKTKKKRRSKKKK